MINTLCNQQNRYKVVPGIFISIYTFFCISLLLACSGCGEKDSVPTFEADFDYSFINDNLVRFENRSTGEYYSIIWDFGNGQNATTTEKNKHYDIYYAQAGDYDVSMRLTDFVGNNRTKEKTINITTTSLNVAFSAEISPGNPNIVNLINLTQGVFDSFKWVFRNREIENEMNYDAYFPFTGIYTIELVAIKEGITYTEQKSINILSDDANYVQNLTLTWSDEFDGNALNTNTWSYATGSSGWGNNELQNYTAGDNIDVSGGHLVITARKIDEDKEIGSYSSSRLITENKKEFQYGRMEIRAKLPSGTGIWPAIWMLGGNFSTVDWPDCGEIDIMEYVGYQPDTVHATIHTPSGFGGSGNGNSIPLLSCEEEFHNYGIIWTENKIDFYIDTPTNITHTYAPTNKSDHNWPFDQTAFFILNIAVGGDWGGAQGINNSIFPQSMLIDYVRVYQESF